MNPGRGIIAAGHEKTAQAAAAVLAQGGNAFDAALAALCAACVAEPVLASLGGGGFLMAKPRGAPPLLYDFFTQTPKRMRPEADTELYPVEVDFGDATQEFHIGKGSIATPGVIAGLFAVHKDLCRMPLAELITPACAFAREGVSINEFQHRFARIIEPILRASPAAFAPHASPRWTGRLATPGEVVRQPELADTMEKLADEGRRLFYDGPWGERLAADCAEGGGHLTTDDLAAYRVAIRDPIACSYRDSRIFTNPPPALGGPLILFALRLLSQTDLGARPHRSSNHIHMLAKAMELTQRLRREGTEGRPPDVEPLAVALLDIMQREARFSRGTTQVSLADADGNLASLTLSNGEGSGYVLPGTGIVLNNMLGEEDINPHGFHRWPPDRRISSMMSPTLLKRADGTWVVTGSSGSNRIRSAILQVLVNLVDFGMSLEEAVAAPRIHFEGDLLNLEPPMAAQVLTDLGTRWRLIKLWTAPSVFFGGAHSILRTAAGQLIGAGDPRRGGTVIQVP
jgi:gamma-glutamyltranspeptidase/glutathione hydrolase